VELSVSFSNERIAIYASGDEPTYGWCVEHCRFVSGVGSVMALAGFNTVMKSLQAEFIAGDAGCHAGNTRRGRRASFAW
jgi:hypothetical protein